mmetsp:Transcript_74979/g.243660  ORF Transcript_74979/g.243660 Transcript_74979/m.243660 type:complete len:261 (+) Transcript_74979:202-984(+)
MLPRLADEPSGGRSRSRRSPQALGRHQDQEQELAPRQGHRHHVNRGQQQLNLVRQERQQLLNLMHQRFCSRRQSSRSGPDVRGCGYVCGDQVRLARHPFLREGFGLADGVRQPDPRQRGLRRLRSRDAPPRPGTATRQKRIGRLPRGAGVGSGQDQEHESQRAQGCLGSRLRRADLRPTVPVSSSAARRMFGGGVRGFSTHARCELPSAAHIHHALDVKGAGGSLRLCKQPEVLPFLCSLEVCLKCRGLKLAPIRRALSE